MESEVRLDPAGSAAPVPLALLRAAVDGAGRQARGGFSPMGHVECRHRAAALVRVAQGCGCHP
eukprot:10944501-Alexandrium_andersonii.AAC.1